MSADKYTWTILMALGRHGLGADVLAAHDAEVAAKALEEAADRLRVLDALVLSTAGFVPVPLSIGRWLLMSDIDHAAEAREFLTIAYMNESDPHEVVCAHVSAQVHATLALVAATEKVAEQARIANLIAYLEIASVHRGGCDESTQALEKRVQEGLGL